MATQSVNTRSREMQTDGDRKPDRLSLHFLENFDQAAGGAACAQDTERGGHISPDTVRTDAARCSTKPSSGEQSPASQALSPIRGGVRHRTSGNFSLGSVKNGGAFRVQLVCIERLIRFMEHVLGILAAFVRGASNRKSDGHATPP
jgi:hypothetical protein